MPNQNGQKSIQSKVTKQQLALLINENDKKIAKRYTRHINTHILNNTHHLFASCDTNDLIERLYNEIVYLHDKYAFNKHTTDNYTTKSPHKREIPHNSSEDLYDDQTQACTIRSNSSIKPSLKFPKSMTIYAARRIKMDNLLEKLQFATENDRIWTVLSEIPDDVKQNILDKMEFDNDYKQSERVKPIIPNYIKVPKKYKDVSFLNDESNDVILSVHYTNYVIDRADCIRHRTLSGQVYYSFYGKIRHHGGYFGNFGFVDGVTSLAQLNTQKSEKKSSKMLPNAALGEMSRESFLALSHMFTLRKLMGNDGKSVVAGNSSKLTMILNRRGTISDASSSSKSNSANSVAPESVDFDLMRKFTERMVNEPKLPHSKKDTRKSKFVSVIHKKMDKKWF